MVWRDASPPWGCKALFFPPCWWILWFWLHCRIKAILPVYHTSRCTRASREHMHCQKKKKIMKSQYRRILNPQLCVCCKGYSPNCREIELHMVAWNLFGRGNWNWLMWWEGGVYSINSTNKRQFEKLIKYKKNRKLKEKYVKKS